MWTRRPRVALTPRAEEMLGPGRRLCQGWTRAGPGQGGLVTHVGPVWTIRVEMWRNRGRQRHKCARFRGEPAAMDHTMLQCPDGAAGLIVPLLDRNIASLVFDEDRLRFDLVPGTLAQVPLRDSNG